MKKLLIFSIAIACLTPAKAQQDPMFSQYLYNMLAINPAYAGSRDLLSSTLFYRNQWTGFEGAPVTLNASVHSPFRSTKGSWGINLLNDRIGIQSQNMINFNYAYRITGSKGNLSLGLSGGMYQFSYNYNNLQLDQQNDPLFQGSETHRLFNVGFGAYYQSSKMALGFSVPHLLTRQLFDQTAFRAVNPNNHIFITGSYIIPLSNDYRFKPSVMLKYVAHAPLQADLNATLIYKNTLYLGISYRTYQEFSIMAQYQLNKNWWFGYAYDIPFGAVAHVSGGSHELFLGFDISFDKSKMLSPRYF
ncbi:MAG: PorP/SprF family type IX secretion system membrane protein [Bacteroidia bacterium]